MSRAATANLVCAICGGELGRTLLVHTTPDRFERHAGVSESGYRREWVECRVCGAAIGRQDPANATRLAKLSTAYYEIDFAGTSIEEKFTKIMALPPERSDNCGRVDRVLEAIGRLPGASRRTVRAAFRVLDIGAGTGVFLARFSACAAERRLQWTGVALEPDPHAAAHLRSLEGFDVVEALFTSQPGLSGFDLITLNKVVEHIAEPVEFLSGVATAVNAGCGLVYVEVPDVLTIAYRPATDNILGALHHHLYTPASLALLFERAGLRALEIGRVFEPSGKITVFGFGGRDQLIAAGAGTYR